MYNCTYSPNHTLQSIFTDIVESVLEKDLQRAVIYTVGRVQKEEQLVKSAFDWRVFIAVLSDLLQFFKSVN